MTEQNQAPQTRPDDDDTAGHRLNFDVDDTGADDVAGHQFPKTDDVDDVAGHARRESDDADDIDDTLGHERGI